MRSELKAILGTLLLLVAACGSGGDSPDARMASADAADEADGALSSADAAIGSADAAIGSADAALADAGGPDDSIRDLQNGTIATGSAVTLAGVVVTARKDTSTSTVLFVQEPSGAPEYAGIMVFIDTDPAPAFTLPAVGDLVTIEGTVSEFARGGQDGSRTNIDPTTSITIDGTAALPTPVVATAASLVFGQLGADQYEGVLVRVDDATVASQDPFAEFTIQDGLKVDDRLFAYTQPFPGDTYTSITGPLDHDFGTSRILPRADADLAGHVAAAPILTDLSPLTASVAPGDTTTFTVTIDRAAPVGGTVIELSSDDAAIAAPQNATVTVAEGATTATFDVVAGDLGGVDIHATLGGTTLDATVTVTDTAPAISSVGPDLTVATGGGTGILTVTLDGAAPSGGTVVSLVSSDAGVIVPASVTVPAGASSATFRARGDAVTAVTATITATTAPSGSASATVTTTLAPPAPVAGNLVINEVAPNAGATAGDASCDGVSDATGDEFVEIVNVSSSVVDMMGVAIADLVQARHVFPAIDLGPGEAVLVFGGGTIGGSTSAAWCAGATPTTIGDARAFTASTGSLGLNNSNETVSLKLGATDLDTPFSYTSSTVATSFTRSPDGSGALVLHTAAVGHATDRDFSPGTLLSGAPFATATP
jgi:hypothetical protein